MSEYTSTPEGFLRFFKGCLNGPVEDAQPFADATTTPTFYQVFNGKRIAREDYIKDLVKWRGKTADFNPVVEEFLRDGDQLAARVKGAITLEGVSTSFETFLFGKVDKESGKLAHLIERSVWAPVDAAP